jgi:hypothetical protein
MSFEAAGGRTDQGVERRIGGIQRTNSSQRQEGSQRHEEPAGEGQSEAVEAEHRCKDRSHEWRVRAPAAA